MQAPALHTRFPPYIIRLTDLFQSKSTRPRRRSRSAAVTSYDSRVSLSAAAPAAAPAAESASARPPIPLIPYVVPHGLQSVSVMTASPTSLEEVIFKMRYTMRTLARQAARSRRVSVEDEALVRKALEEGNQKLAKVAAVRVVAKRREVRQYECLVRQLRVVANELEKRGGGEGVDEMMGRIDRAVESMDVAEIGRVVEGCMAEMGATTEVGEGQEKGQAEGGGGEAAPAPQEAVLEVLNKCEKEMEQRREEKVIESKESGRAVGLFGDMGGTFGCHSGIVDDAREGKSSELRKFQNAGE